MTTESFIVKDDTPTSSTYVRMAANGSESLYRDDSSTLTNPLTLRVSHQAAKDAAGSDRTLVKFARVDDDADGTPYTGSVHVVLAKPREGVSIADLTLEWEKLKNHVDANIALYMGGFFPSVDCP